MSFDQSFQALGFALGAVALLAAIVVLWLVCKAISLAEFLYGFPLFRIYDDDPDLERPATRWTLFVVGLVGLVEAPVFVRPLVDSILVAMFFGGVGIGAFGMLFPGSPILGGVGEAEHFEGVFGKEKEEVAGVGVLARVTHRVPMSLAALVVGIAIVGFGLRGAFVPGYIETDSRTRWIAVVVFIVFGLIIALGAGALRLLLGEDRDDLMILTEGWFCLPWDDRPEMQRIPWPEVRDIRHGAMHVPASGSVKEQDVQTLEIVGQDGQVLDKIVTTKLPHADRIEKILTATWRDQAFRARLAEPYAVAHLNTVARGQG